MKFKRISHFLAVAALVSTPLMRTYAEEETQSYNATPSDEPQNHGLAPSGSQTSLSSSAQPNIFSLHETLTSSLRHHPQMKAVLYSQLADEQKVIQARSSFFPRISAQAQMAHGLPGSSSGLGLGGLVASPWRKDFAGGIVLDQTIWDFGRTLNAIQVAHQKASASSANIEIAKIPILTEAIGAYYTCARDRSLISLYSYLLKEAQVVEKEIEQFVRSSQRSIVDKYLAETQIAELQTAVKDSEKLYELDLVRIRILTGIEGTDYDCIAIDDSRITTEFETSELAKALSSMTQKDSPLLQRELSLSHLSLAEVKLARSEYNPKLMTTASVGYIGETWAPVTASYYSIAVGLIIPIFEGFKLSATYDEAKARSLASGWALEAADLELKNANTKLDRSIESARVRVENLKKEILVSEKAFHLAKTRYFSFQGHLLDLREALRNLSRTRTDYRESLYNFLKTSSEKAVLNGAARTLEQK